MKVHIFLALAALAAAAEPASAEPLADAPKIAAKIRAADLWLQTTLEHEAVPAASVAIVHDQEVIWAKGYGFSNLAAKTPATADTRYSVCSITKLFTSIGAMQLRDQGRLDLDKPVSDYLPWFKIKEIKAAEEPITIRNILSHVSGLPREADMPYWGEIDFPNADSIRKIVETQTKLYRPYDYFQYSNLGMSLVGETIAQISGRSYHDYMREKILTPLRMTETTTDLPENLYGKEFAIGYTARNGRGERAPIPSYRINGVAPAAGLASSVNDLAKFAAWQFRLLEKGGEEILKATTLREMQRVHWTGADFEDPIWGLGFAARRHNEKTFWGHGGYCPGYRSELIMRPQDKLAYIVIVNVNDTSPSDIAFDLYDLTGADIAKTVNERKEAAEGKDDKNKTGASGKGKKNKVDFTIYEGVYSREGTDADTWYGYDGEKLFSIALYTDDPAESLTEFEHIEGHIFKRKRDDETLAEEIRFEIGDDGRAIRVWQHSNYLTRR